MKSRTSSAGVELGAAALRVCIDHSLETGAHNAPDIGCNSGWFREAVGHYVLDYYVVPAADDAKQLVV